MVVQRLTKPVLLTNGEPELIDELEDAVIVEPVEEPQDRYREAGSQDAVPQDAIPQEAAPQEAEYQETAVAEVDIKLLREKIRALRAAKAEAAAKPKPVRRARTKAA